MPVGVEWGATTIQEREAPLRWRGHHQARLPYGLTPCESPGCVYSSQKWVKVVGSGAPPSTPYRHSAYGIGRNCTPSLSEMGMEMDMKGAFMQMMMSEP